MKELRIIKKITASKSNTAPYSFKRYSNEFIREVDNLMVCDDCGHNCVEYEPAKDGFCNCGCH